MISLSEATLINQRDQNLPDISTDHFILGLIFILSMAAMAYVSVAVSWTKFSRAEVFFAECSREMLIANNFITPLYHQHAFFDKPIFVYWLIIGMFKTLGVNHLAARLPSIFASLITIASTALAGRALFGRSGLLAASILGSAFMYLSFSSLCMSDIFLVMFDVLSLTAVYAGIQLAEKRSFIWWLASVSIGFAFLTKGPVGLVLPVAASLIYLTLTKNLGLIKLRHVLFALITIAIIASPWFYAAYLANGSSALIYFFIHENVQRFAGSAYDAHKPFGYMVLGFFLGFAPWSIFLPSAFFQFYTEIKKEITASNLPWNNVLAFISTLPNSLSAQMFLWLWVFVSVGFFCLSKGQCDYYTLPAYPAAAVLVAKFLDNQFQKYFLKSNKIIPWSVGLITAAYMVMTVMAGGCATKLMLSGAKNFHWDVFVSEPALVAMAYFLLVVTGIIIFLNKKRKYFDVIGVAGCGIFAITVFFAYAVLPGFSHLEPVDNIASVLKRGPNDLRVGVDKAVASWIDEILFQSGKDAQRLDDLDQMRQFVADSSPAVLIIPMDKYKRLLIDDNKAWRIIAGYRTTTHSLTPGYVISHKGRITDPVPLIVATNVARTKL